MILNYRLPRSFDLGTAYTMIAGLLNLLAIYDAWGGPVFPEPVKPKEDDEEDERNAAAGEKQKKS